MPPLPLLYLVHREALSSVFSSQVLTPLAEHQRWARVSLGLLTPVGHLLRSQYRPTLKAIETSCRKAAIDVTWIPSPPARISWLWSDAFLLRQWISKHYGREQPLLVRCRNAGMTRIALQALHPFEHVRVIFDCRGAEVTELIQQLGVQNLPKSEWPVKVRRTIAQADQRERIAVTQSDGVTCVSQVMSQMLQQRYPEVSPDKFRVVPCCPNVEQFQQAIPQRTSVRKELGLDQRFVVTYLGSLVWYQQPEASLRIFRIIQSFRPDAHFLAITTSPDKMRELAIQAGIAPASMTIRSVPPHEVPRLLVASDCGLMLRDDSETNRVASPVKMGEYLAAGVPVIITPRLGDSSELVSQHRLGTEVDLAWDDGQLSRTLSSAFQVTQAESDTQRTRCTSYAATELAWGTVIPRLVDWYQELLDQPRCPSTHPAPSLTRDAR